MSDVKKGGEDEFLWLVSLSDLMILLFIFFVVLFSFTFKKLTQADLQKISAAFRSEILVDPIEVVEKNLLKWANDQKINDLVTITRIDDAITIDIRDKLLFAPGQFMPHEEGLRVLKFLSPVIEKIPKPYKIGIEGHTDDSPIHTDTIEDNWDLSAKRALAILRNLDLSIPLLRRAIAMAFGEMKPIVPNRDAMGRPAPENQAKNRRVTIRIF